MIPSIYNRIVFVLSLIGAGVAVYLTIHHINNISLPCMATSGCDEVMHHPFSNGLGIHGLESIPTAAFGLMAYIALTILSFARVASGSDVIHGYARTLQWLVSLVGVAVSAWLTYLEAYVIHAWCIWCVGSAAIILLICSRTTNS